PKSSGMNRATWDLRYDPPRPGPTFGGRGGGRGSGAAEGATADVPAETEGRFGGSGAPFVLPGAYTVRVRTGSREESKTVKVEMDPRVPVSAADLQAQLDAALTLRDMISRVNMVIERTNNLVQQLTALQDRLKRSPVPTTTTTNHDHGGDGAAQQNAAGNQLPNMVSAALDATRKLLEDDLTRPYPGMGYRQY